MSFIEYLVTAISTVLSIWGAFMAWTRYSYDRQKDLDNSKSKNLEALETLKREFAKLQFDQVEQKVIQLNIVFEKASKEIEDVEKELNKTVKDFAVSQREMEHLILRFDNFVQRTEERFKDFGRVIRMGVK